jgi:replicative DNA helicase
MSEARFQSAADLLDDWRDSILSGTPPTLYPVGSGALARIEIGPGLVTLIGGAPNIGKSALVMQLVFDALRLTPELRAIVCNVEMSPAALLDRQLARLAGIPLTPIRYRRLDAEHAGRVERGMHDLERLADRLAFVRPPFDLANIAASADAFEAGLIVLDYIQRIGPPPGTHGDRRGAVDATMSYLRQFADVGIALIVVAAVARSKDAKGRSSYGAGLSLASFRETSELEYGADDAFILVPADDGDGEDGPLRRVVLRHLKSRHGETRDIPLIFDGAHQRFSTADPVEPKGRADGGKLSAALRGMWYRAEPAGDDDDGGEE